MFFLRDIHDNEAFLKVNGFKQKEIRRDSTYDSCFHKKVFLRNGSLNIFILNPIYKELDDYKIVISTNPYSAVCREKPYNLNNECGVDIDFEEILRQVLDKAGYENEMNYDLSLVKDFQIETSGKDLLKCFNEISKKVDELNLISEDDINECIPFIVMSLVTVTVISLLVMFAYIVK